VGGAAGGGEGHNIVLAAMRTPFPPLGRRVSTVPGLIGGGGCSGAGYCGGRWFERCASPRCAPTHPNPGPTCRSADPRFLPSPSPLPRPSPQPSQPALPGLLCPGGGRGFGGGVGGGGAAIQSRYPLMMPALDLLPPPPPPLPPTPWKPPRPGLPCRGPCAPQFPPPTSPPPRLPPPPSQPSLGLGPGGGGLGGVGAAATQCRLPLVHASAVSLPPPSTPWRASLPVVATPTAARPLLVCLGGTPLWKRFTSWRSWPQRRSEGRSGSMQTLHLFTATK